MCSLLSQLLLETQAQLRPTKAMTPGRMRLTSGPPRFVWGGNPEGRADWDCSSVPQFPLGHISNSHVIYVYEKASHWPSGLGLGIWP